MARTSVFLPLYDQLSLYCMSALHFYNHYLLHSPSHFFLLPVPHKKLQEGIREYAYRLTQELSPLKLPVCLPGKHNHYFLPNNAQSSI